MADKSKVVSIPDTLSVRDLADLLEVSPIEVMKLLIGSGIMANINQTVDYDTAAIVATDLGFEIQQEIPAAVEEVPAPPSAPAIPEEVPLKEIYAQEAPEDLKPRAPVVTVLGHVNHGKTSLLDYIRHTNVVDGEAGGITQHTGAYQVEQNGKKITFIDTPGHEAFTAMRARGAQVTDIAVLVVAADDGVMPQTKEAIDHARSANVPIVVAINKIDLPSADPERVKKQLADFGLTVEDWGGHIIAVLVSAKEGTGTDTLLEMILLVTEMSDIRANPDRPAAGTVLEGKLERSRGPTATLLVQNGTLTVGDHVVIGEIHGRVRAMFNHAGKSVKAAPPSFPVVVLGLSDVPQPGDMFKVVSDEKTARALAAERAEERRAKEQAPVRALSLDDIYAQMQAGTVKELNVILKADVQGTLEPIVGSLEKLGDQDLKVKIIHAGIGNITESDVSLAVASQAIVIGFNVQAEPASRTMAEVEGVEVRHYRVIYRLIEDIDKALKGLLEPVYEDVVMGHAEVRATFRASKLGRVAGVYVEDGVVKRNAQAKVLRDNEEIYDGTITSLKRFTEDVKEVTEGLECGVGLADFTDFEEGDIIEVYKKERVA
ncbi:MAG: translation initiation factor IF-2 [Chloroflexi bacterium B3_Chlor]|nr:MAG: translation initiation factor IF-2 [Chloroflexi bacterium B3_Chlor]